MEFKDWDHLISGGSVKVMRSYDYCHFEISLSTDIAGTQDEVDGLRKVAARLADKAVAQYKIAKTNAAKLERDRENFNWQLQAARATPESGRTEEQKAIIKTAEDKAYAERCYDYDDDWADE